MLDLRAMFVTSTAKMRGETSYALWEPSTHDWLTEVDATNKKGMTFACIPEIYLELVPETKNVLKLLN